MISKAPLISLLAFCRMLEQHNWKYHHQTYPGNVKAFLDGARSAGRIDRCKDLSPAHRELYEAYYLWAHQGAAKPFCAIRSEAT